MSFIDVIAKKRDGRELSRDDLDGFIRGVCAGELPDYQIAALLMAILLQGMTDQEAAWLTDAMVRSGERVNLSEVPGVKVGKHSTGGVGDKISIALAPVVAACGVSVPKMSGRGLGHTGGTLDKLEAIPGFRVNLTLVEFTREIAEIGLALVGQTATLAPADKTLYALRDVTATVPSIPLIAASVMSKKLAEGSDALVLDVKCGDGAFMKSESDARELARLMVAIGTRAGVRTEAVITDMQSPLGRAVGNALEIIECVELLRGRGPADVVSLVATLAVRMLVLSGQYTEATAESAVRTAIASGQALAKFKAMVTWQGGDPRALEDYHLLPQASHRRPIVARRDGYVASLRADLVGRASMALGAGRVRVEDRVDHGAGVLIARKPGDAVRAGDTVIELLYNRDSGLEEAVALALESIEITGAPPARRPLVLGVVT